MRFNASAAQAAIVEELPQEAPAAPPGPHIMVLPSQPPSILPGSIGAPPVPLGAPPKVLPAKPKLNFGGIKTKTTAAPSSDYPVLPDPDGKLAEQAAAFLEALEAETAACGAKEAARLELSTTISRTCWTRGSYSLIQLSANTG